jgi:hypothetical protein
MPCQHRIKLPHLSNPFITEHVFIYRHFIRLDRLRPTDFNPNFLEKIRMHLVSFLCLISLIINCLESAPERSNIYRQIFRLPVLKYCQHSCVSYQFPEELPVATTERYTCFFIICS